MKKYLSLPLIVLALLAMFIYVGCSAKGTPPVTTTAAAEAPLAQESQEMREPHESAEEAPELKNANRKRNTNLPKKHQKANRKRNTNL